MKIIPRIEPCSVMRVLTSSSLIRYMEGSTMNIRIASMKYTLNAPSARRVGVRTVTMIPINSKSQHKKQISNVANLLLFPISNDRRLVTPRLKLCSLVL